MKALFSLSGLLMALWITGCATNQSPGGAKPAQPRPAPQPSATDSQWEFKTVAIYANSEPDFHEQVMTWNRQGWSIVSSTAVTHAGPQITATLVLKKPRS